MFASNAMFPQPTNPAVNPLSVPKFTSTGTLTPQQQQLMDQLSSGLNGGSGPLALNPQATADYIQKSVAAPLMQEYQQSIMPRINDAYASVGALLGSRRGFAQQQALQSLQTNVAQQLGQAQLSNQQLQAQLASGLVNQSQQAIQPYVPQAAAAGSGASINFPPQDAMGGVNGGFNGFQPIFGANRGWNQGNGYAPPVYNPPPQQPYGGVSFTDVLSGKTNNDYSSMLDNSSF